MMLVGFVVVWVVRFELATLSRVVFVWVAQDESVVGLVVEIGFVAVFAVWAELGLVAEAGAWERQFCWRRVRLVRVRLGYRCTVHTFSSELFPNAGACCCCYGSRCRIGRLWPKLL